MFHALLKSKISCIMANVSSRQDVYQLVTDIILEKLEQGVIP